MPAHCPVEPNDEERSSENDHSDDHDLNPLLCCCFFTKGHKKLSVFTHEQRRVFTWPLER